MKPKKKKEEVYLYQQTENVERDAWAYRSIFSPFPTMSRFQNTMFPRIMHDTFGNFNTAYKKLTMRATFTQSLKNCK